MPEPTPLEGVRYLEKERGWVHGEDIVLDLEERKIKEVAREPVDYDPVPWSKSVCFACLICIPILPYTFAALLAWCFRIFFYILILILPHLCVFFHLLFYVLVNVLCFTTFFSFSVTFSMFFLISSLISWFVFLTIHFLIPILLRVFFQIRSFRSQQTILFRIQKSTWTGCWCYLTATAFLWGRHFMMIRDFLQRAINHSRKLSTIRRYLT